MEKQNQMAQGLLEQKQRESVVQIPDELSYALDDLKNDLEEVDEEEAGEKIKNCIEKA